MNTKYESTKIIKKILLIVFAIFVFAIAWRFFNLLSFPDSSITLQKGETVKVQPGESVTQKFESKRDGIMKIQLLLRGPGVKYENGDKMEMEILDENCEKTIREGELKKSFLEDENLYEFVFKKIPNSDGKKYCLSATFSPKKDSARAIQIFTLGKGENQPYSIRPAYKNDNIFQDLSELNKRLSQYKPFFLKHYYLWIIMIGFVLLATGLVVTLIVL